ncbi:hypothetical protein QBC34DRAFT_410876 [Podospora aff. communis PSN243]|uniref:Uncharacterized protein n=1 Tax=Podospora aff. communis PSN243 TaxID=3040156 RepID=A0AAV9GDC0_9PEZI|nr:hypothetical protein QBC34DRAFT_410876 [Podospora aff. communis PSN243]
MPRHFPPQTSQPPQQSTSPTGSHLTSGGPPCGGGQPDSATVAKLYRLSKLARAKLYREAAIPDRNLLRLVGHANLLDDVLQRLDDADEERESWYDESDDESDEEEDIGEGCVEVGGDVEVEEIEGEVGRPSYYPHLRGDSESDSDSDEDSESEESDEDWEDFQGDEASDSSEEDVDQCLCCEGEKEDGNGVEVKVVGVSEGEETENAGSAQTASEDFPVCIGKLVEAVDAMSIEVHPQSSGFRNGCVVQFWGPSSWR